MGYVYYNPNVKNTDFPGDCTVRAIAKVMGWDWDTAYANLCLEGFIIGDMPSANRTMISFMLARGFQEHSLFSRCKNCYSVQDFAKDNPSGAYILCTGSHVVAVIDGNWYDSWDSGAAIPIYYFAKKEGINAE